MRTFNCCSTFLYGVHLQYCKIPVCVLVTKFIRQTRTKFIQLFKILYYCVPEYVKIIK